MCYKQRQKTVVERIEKLNKYSKLLYGRHIVPPPRVFYLFLIVFQLTIFGFINSFVY